jgi:hypothetical protein
MSARIGNGLPVRKTYAKDAYGVPSTFSFMRPTLPQKKVGRRVAVICSLKTVLNLNIVRLSSLMIAGYEIDSTLLYPGGNRSTIQIG